MSKPFDATLKDLANQRPADYVTTFDAPPKLPVRSLNIDLSTVTTSGDLVLGLGKPLQEIVHLDFQAGPDADKHRDVLVYNCLLHRHYKIPVHSVLVLLRRQAAHRHLTGEVAYAPRQSRGRMHFGYEVVRLWEREAEQLVAGPLGTAPLAVLGLLPPGMGEIPGLKLVVERLIQRLEREAEPGDLQRLLTSAFVLTGLRLDRAGSLAVFKGVRSMQESSTYIMILEEGIQKGLQQGIEQGIEKGIEQGIEKGIEQGMEKGYRQAILDLGVKLHGKATAATRKKLEAITDMDHLKRIHDRLVDARGWADLLATP